MLVKRQIFFITCILTKCRAKPMRKNSCYASNIFPINSFWQGSSSTTRIIRYDHFETWILSSRAKRSFPLSGMSHYCNFTHIYSSLTFQIINNTTWSPSPNSNCFPLIMIFGSWYIIREKRSYTIISQLCSIRIDIMITHSRYSISTF